MTDNNLNLARKWRSKTFDTIIGQDLSLRILKNSLYLNHFFPVYLFSGQRGCGKTTTARVFAAAVNCEQLSSFQKSPKNHSIPCGVCTSCAAMQTTSHPDFIEIDAASHTGVDNVRQIIEAASLLPLLGRKKIYLIDEAHMLSRAAFNAFLKIMEEPPASVLFILATTDAQKIIETVKSRSFQLFFTPVVQDQLQQHLVTVCQAESIAYEDDALALIIKESEGSVRDALNLLEQVRFSHPKVTKAAVLAVLGVLSDEQMIELFAAILTEDTGQLLAKIRALELERYSAELLLARFVELIRHAMWLQCGISLHDALNDALMPLVKMSSTDQLQEMLTIGYEHELAITRTTKKHILLEVVLLKMQAIVQKKRPQTVQLQKTSSMSARSIAPQQPIVPQQNVPTIESKEQKTHVLASTAPASPWQTFLMRIETLNDPLLKSIFSQAALQEVTEDGAVLVSFSAQYEFFQDWLVDCKKVWEPLLKEVFGAHAQLRSQFSAEVPAVVSKPVVEKKTITIPEPAKAPERTFKPYQTQNSIKKQPTPGSRSSIAKINERKIDISDTAQWPKATILLNYFAGTVHEISDN